MAFGCGMCGRSGKYEVLDDDPGAVGYCPDLVERATELGTIEYEVGGPYVTRGVGGEDGLGFGGPHENGGRVDGGNTPRPPRPVHLFAMDVVDRPRLRDYVDAVRRMSSELGRRRSAARRRSGRPSSTGAGGGPRVGFFAFRSDGIVVPYLRRRRTFGLGDSAGRVVRDGVGEVAAPPLARRDGDDDGDDGEKEEEEELAAAVVADVSDDPFSPLPLSDWTYDVLSGEDLIRLNRALDGLLPLLEEMLPAAGGCGGGPVKVNQVDTTLLSCGGAALAVLADALSAARGMGRGTVLTSRRPSYGVGALRDREAGDFVGRGHSPAYNRWTTERELWTPLQDYAGEGMKVKESTDARAGRFYDRLGKRCADDGTSLDVVMTMPLRLDLGEGMRPAGTTYLDVATLSELCRVTSGRFRWVRPATISSPSKEAYLDALREELTIPPCSYAGHDAVFKVRVSEGLRVQDIISHGPGRMVRSGGSTAMMDDGSPEVEWSYVSPDTSVAVTLDFRVGGIPAERDERGYKSDADPAVYVQTALLYTTPDGRRRVRVSTLGLRTTKSVSDIFRCSDLGAIATILTRRSVSKARRTPTPDVIRDGGPLASARNDLTRRTIAVLGGYRMHTSARSSPVTQLILPETLQILPLFTLGLRKSEMLRESLSAGPAAASGEPCPSGDERAYGMHLGGTASRPETAMLQVHPDLYRLDGAKFGGAGAGDDLPPLLCPSVTSLDDDGAYLLDCHTTMFVYVGARASPEVRDGFLGEVAPPGEGGRKFREQRGSAAYLTLSMTSDMGRRVGEVIRRIRAYNSLTAAGGATIRPSYAPVIVVAGRGAVSGSGGGNNGKGDGDGGLGGRFMSHLVDDAMSHERGYVDFLCGLHKRVREFAENADTLPWEQ